MRQIIGSIEGEYRRYKAVGERAIDQLTDAQLSQASGDGGNSVATLVWHISGNLASRFTDFLREDGEKPLHLLDALRQERNPLLVRVEEGRRQEPIDPAPRHRHADPSLVLPTVLPSLPAPSPPVH